MALDVGASFKITAGVSGQDQLDRLNKSVREVGATAGTSAKQTAAAFRTLPAQFTDIATQLAGGQSPLLILLQQGGQIKDSFGGFGATFRAFAAVLTPMRLLVGGVASAIGTVAFAAYQGREEFDKFNKTLALTGNVAGVTWSKFQAMAGNVTASAGGTIGANKDMLMGALGTGAFGQQSLEPAMQAMVRLRDLSGQTSEAIVKDFAQMANGVAAWAAAHNRIYGYLTLDQFKYIQALERAGRTEEAMALNAKLLNAELELRKPQLGYLEQAWKSVGQAASWAWDKMMNVGRPDTLEQQIEAARAKLENFRRAAADERTSNTVRALAAEQAQVTERELDDLQRQQKETKKLTEYEAALMAQRKKAVEDEASGLNDRKRNAGLDAETIVHNEAKDRRLAVIERERLAVEQSRAMSLIGERDYIDRLAGLRDRELEIEIQVQRRQAIIEGERPVKDAADAMQRANRVRAIEATISKLQEQRATNSSKASADGAAADDRRNKALDYYIADLAFSNEMLALQARQIDMTDEAFRRMVDTKRAEHEIGVKTRGMTAADAKAYRDAAEQALALSQAVEAVNYEQSRTWQYGAKAALKTYTDAVSNAAKLTEGFMTRSFQSIEDSLVELATTGKTSFRDLATSIIKDLIRIQIQQSIMRPLSGFLSGVLGNVVGAFLPGGGSAAFPSGVDYTLSSGSSGLGLKLPGRASGGPVNYGRAYLVGENGPEIMVPGTSGTVIPNGGIGGVQNNVSIGITVDAGSGRVSTTGGTDDGARALGRKMAEAARSVIINEQRPGGLLWGAR